MLCELINSFLVKKLQLWEGKSLLLFFIWANKLFTMQMLDACHFPRRKLNICSVMYHWTSLIVRNVAHIIHVFHFWINGGSSQLINCLFVHDQNFSQNYWVEDRAQAEDCCPPFWQSICICHRVKPFLALHAWWIKCWSKCWMRNVQTKTLGPDTNLRQKHGKTNSWKRFNAALWSGKIASLILQWWRSFLIMLSITNKTPT